MAMLSTGLGRPCISVRTLGADDAAWAGEVFALLGPETLYRRFGRARVEATAALDWVQRLDAGRHVAVGGCECASASPVGIARYVRETPDAAELAVTVIDSWQRRGVGTLLVRHLLRHAAADGIQELHAFVTPGNRAAMALMRGIGGRRIGAPGWGGFIEYAAHLNGSAPAPAGASPGQRPVPPAPAGPPRAVDCGPPRASGCCGRRRARTSTP
jgi:RimJ/RimL family protein N-acetyltransferase